ncbi:MULTISPECIES: hypothetical protein [unclassified Leifsonia]|uniref:hypothetical protein n=1 Tax=unclassified Leifsonia TaxID=2663824 RepID=UPI0008A7F06D|nr:MULTISPECIES: hypothetical protein [unclassified Leifsonia]SEH57150.1 hypothetical protein SAMN04515694_101159 [Leifsonia sp. CL154]SFL21704.1 hypothetical protein SAMN04515692_101320 [Leifsonia sp. CL147]
MRNLRTAAVAAIVLTAGALLAGCTSTAPAPTATRTAAATNIPGLPAGVQQEASLPTDIPNDPAARATLQLSTCAKTDTGWKAGGTIANPGKKPVTRTITVFFTTEHATVIKSGQTKVTVDAGKKQDWSIAPAFAAAPKTLCVIRGVG